MLTIYVCFLACCCPSLAWLPVQALYKSATDESAHLMHELTIAAESARRTAVKLRGRETGGLLRGGLSGGPRAGSLGRMS